MKNKKLILTLAVLSSVFLGCEGEVQTDSCTDYQLNDGISQYIRFQDCDPYDGASWQKPTLAIEKGIARFITIENIGGVEELVLYVVNGSVIQVAETSFGSGIDFDYKDKDGSIPAAEVTDASDYRVDEASLNWLKDFRIKTEILPPQFGTQAIRFDATLIPSDANITVSFPILTERRIGVGYTATEPKEVKNTYRTVRKIFTLKLVNNESLIPQDAQTSRQPFAQITWSDDPNLSRPNGGTRQTSEASVGIAIFSLQPTELPNGTPQIDDYIQYLLCRTASSTPGGSSLDCDNNSPIALAENQGKKLLLIGEALTGASLFQFDPTPNGVTFLQIGSSSIETPVECLDLQSLTQQLGQSNMNTIYSLTGSRSVSSPTLAGCILTIPPLGKDVIREIPLGIGWSVF